MNANPIKPPTESRLPSLLKLLGGPRDNALLRFSLGNEYLKESNWAAATEHFKEAIARDPRLSAAWKALGKAYNELGDIANATHAYEQGIATAEAQGDRQAVKEMQVFLKRLQQRAAAP